MTYGITNAGGGKSADLGTKTITANDTYLASDDGLDGYSEVTVNVPAPAPNLQSKIARQNGTVTADSGYDGLSSVDVGVGQIGSAYSCSNKSGGSYATNDKVWLNYKQATAQRIDSIGSGTAYQDYRGLTMTFDGSKIARSNYASTSFARYSVSSGSAPTYIDAFTLNYQSAQIMFIEDTVTYILPNYTANMKSHVAFANSGVTTSTDRGYLGGGFCCDGYNLRDSETDTILWQTPSQAQYSYWCGFRYSATYRIGIIRDSGNQRVKKLVIDNGVATESSWLSCYLANDIEYNNCLGYTSDGKYLISGKNRIIDVANWVYKTWPSLETVTKANDSLSYFNNVGNLLTFKGTDGYLHTFKYSPISDDWSEVTELKVQTTNTQGMASYDGSYLIYTSDGDTYNSPVSLMQVAQNEGWVATQYGNINSDSLTGYAAEPISAGATGNVIVGQRVDGTSITATNNSSYDRISGEKVWLLENNGSYQITDVLGLTSRSFTGITKEAIAIGASGACEATVGGELVVRWARNFSIAGGPSIDDGARIVTFTGGYQGVYKVLTTGTSTPATSVTVQLKSKFTGSGSNHNQSTPFAVFGSGYGSYANVDYPLLELVNTKGLYYRIKQGIGNVGAQEKTLLDNTAWVNNKWYWIKLEVTDTLVASYWSEDGTTWNAGPTISGSGLLASFANRTVFGFRSFYDNTTYNGTVDMNESWVKVDGDIVWQPYAPITE
ncbi:MAG: hypothetical protein J6X75_05085 [Clostridia bacterium]|nr:hypothetical protein [Clostridia bacterium]